jgi:hypothetical protein
MKWTTDSGNVTTFQITHKDPDQTLEIIFTVDNHVIMT